MSVLVQVKSVVKSMSALNTACTRLGLKLLPAGQYEVWAKVARGVAVRLPGWQYHVVIDPVTGVMVYDNHNGSWGEIRHLDKLLQAYNVAAIEEEAAREGCQVETSVDPVTGDIVMDVVVAASEY